jgi:hypothetical protein
MIIPFPFARSWLSAAPRAPVTQLEADGAAAPRSSQATSREHRFNSIIILNYSDGQIK